MKILFLSSQNFTNILFNSSDFKDDEIALEYELLGFLKNANKKVSY